MRRGPKEKKERALGERLQLKAHRCSTPKCAAVRKPYRPGMHGQKRRRQPSDFGRQVLEKRKFMAVYGVSDKVLRRLFDMAQKSETGTSMKLMELLERRLDNAVFRAGIAGSRLEARQFVVHGHISVNGERVKSPSFQVGEGDVISVHENSRENADFKDLSVRLEKFNAPSWLELDASNLAAKVISIPDNVDSSFQTNLLVESYSK